MTKKQEIQLFNDRKIRTVWDDKEEKWYFSIVDTIAALTESLDAVAYWRKLKQRLKAEGNESVTNCHALKMLAADGKMRLTDIADQLFLIRIPLRCNSLVKVRTNNKPWTHMSFRPQLGCPGGILFLHLK